MPFPTDRGYVLITKHDDGTSTVEVAARFVGGTPAGVFAKHVGVHAVRVARQVQLSGTATRRFTRQVVEVLPGGGAILVRPVTELRSPAR